MHRSTRKIALPALIALAVALAAGCSRQARQARYESRADKYFEAGRYPQAEVEYLNVLKLNRTNAHAIGRLGTIYFDDGQLPKAYPLLRKAAELEPDDPAVRLRSGMIHLAEGNYQDARADAEAILRRTPGSEEAPLLLARSARTREELSDVKQQLQNLLQQKGASAPLNVGLGTVLQLQGDIPGAEAAFRRALELNPESSSAHFALGTIYLAQTNLAKADLEFKAAADLGPPRSPRRLDYADFKIKSGKVDEAKQILSQVTKDVPDYLPAWLKLAQIALAQKQPDQCESMLNQVLVRDPNNYDALSLNATLKLSKGETDKSIAILDRLKTVYDRAPLPRYNLALAYLSKGDAVQALRNLDEAITLNTNFDDAILLKAQINIRRDNTDAAVPALTQLIQRRPQLAQAYLLLGAAYTATSRFNDALATYRRLQELYPKNPQVPLLMGIILQQQGKKDLARSAFEKSSALAPDYLPALEQLVRLDLADKQYDAARRRIQERLDKTPDSPQLQFLLAQVCIARNDTAEAEVALQKAIRSNPEYQPAYMLLAQLYADTRRNEKALAQIQEVLAKNPRDASALLLKGMIENEQKNYDAARATYENLLTVNSNSVVALNNLAYLYSEKFHLLDKAYNAARKAKDLLSSNPSADPRVLASADDTLGWILYQRGEYSWALGLLQESAEKLPGEPEVQFHLGMAYYMQGDTDRARKALQQTLALNKDFREKNEADRRLALLAIDPRTAGPAEVAKLEAQVRAEPEDPIALGRLAAIYERQGSPERAAEAYQLALKHNPKNARLMIGLALLDAELLHQPDKALQLAKDAYRLAPEDADVSYALGRLAFETGDYKWAVSLLELSARRMPDDPGLRYHLAIAYYSVGRVGDAESAMRSALQADTSFARAAEAKQFLELVVLPADPAKSLAGEPRARQILQTDPTNVPALMVVATASEQQGHADTARRAYEQVLDQYPYFVPAMKQLTILNSERALQDQKAYDLAMKAREALPDDPEVAKALGIILYRREDFRGAVRLLTESNRSRTADATALYYLGMAHFRLKQTADSKAELQRALTLEVPDPLAAEAKRVLAEMK